MCSSDLGSTNFIYKAVTDGDPAVLKTDLEAIKRKLRAAEAIEQKLKAAVDAGKLSPAEAKEKLGAIQQKMSGPTKYFYKAVTGPDPAALKADLVIIERKVAGDEGKLSPPAAKEQLGAIALKNNFIYKAVGDTDPAALKAEIEVIEHKLKTEVDEGKLSPPAAKEQLGAKYQKMPGPANYFYLELTDRDPAALKAEFEAIERKLKAAVEHGKLSPAEAKRALGAIHQEMFGASNDKAP